MYGLRTRTDARLDFRVALPWGRRVFAGAVYADVPARAFALSAGGNTMYVAGGDGAISIVDLALGTVDDTPVTGELNEFVCAMGWFGPSDRKRLYVARARRDGDGLAENIRVFDMESWKPVGTIHTSAGFRSAGVSRDGATIYALTGRSAGILRIDTAALRELPAIGVGQDPSFFLIAP